MTDFCDLLSKAYTAIYHYHAILKYFYVGAISFFG
jgi:hypothetical protein